jgi:PAS domain S-box-containing protein
MTTGEGTGFQDRQGQTMVLVVDDSVAHAQLVATHLEYAGYRVRLAYDGPEALAAVAAEPPDLIILDVMMPEMDGFQVCEWLRTNRSTRFTPIVLLTALNEPRDRIRGLEIGADEFLSKPFNREELLARVRSLLRLKFARDALQTERNRLALLYDISQGINSQLAVDEVLRRIVNHTRQALQANMCSILILEQDRSQARQFISREGAPPMDAKGVTPVVFQEGLAAWILKHGQSTVVEDTSCDPRWLVLPGDTFPVGSVIGAPMLVAAEMIGVLLATHPRPRSFDEGHLAVLDSIAAQAAVAVRNAQLYEVEQRRRRELEMLQRTAVALSAELNWDVLVHLIVEQAATLLAAPAASLMLLDEAGEQLTIAAWRGFSQRYAHGERLPWSQVAQRLGDNGRSFQILDLGQQESLGHSALLLQEGVVSQLSLALLASGRFWGLINIYSRADPRLFAAHEIQLAETFAQQAAIALVNARLLQDTREERGKLSAVLSSTTDAVLVVDEAGNLILANPAAEQILRAQVASRSGRPLAGYLPAEFLSVFDRVAQEGRPFSAEVARHDRTYYLSVSPVAGVGQVAVIQDITALKELEAMRLQAEQQERRHIRQMFERYVGPELVDRILAQEAGMLERRERRDAVVLFTDLRGFTQLTLAVPAYTVIEVLNEFFTEMIEVVHTHQGTVFDLAGDELMVAFGVPLAQSDASQRALQAAGVMQQTFAGLRRRWQADHGIEVGLGVGIDQGQVVMGSIGAARHMNFGLMGYAVNMAHRLVELAQHGEIVVSEAVYGGLGGKLEGWTFEALPPYVPVGRGQSLQIYLAHHAAAPGQVLQET